MISNLTNKKEGGPMRDAILRQVWEAQDEAYDLMYEYDTLPHCYGEDTLYQAEGHIIDLIAIHPGITATDLAEILKKTVSACSQMIRKLRAKGWVEQTRNAENNRLYNLTLTERGAKLYEAHVAFNRGCQAETFKLLEGFTQEELEAHVRVQQALNEAYRGDVRRCREQMEQA